ncbi:hypothetical protein FOL47_008201, partial [Perkinsus chesapeaki]
MTRLVTLADMDLCLWASLRELTRTSESDGFKQEDSTSLLGAIKAISAEIVPKETFAAIICETRKLLKCERVRLYVCDKTDGLLISAAVDEEDAKEVEVGEGIVGRVFATKNAESNVRDAESVTLPVTTKCENQDTSSVLAVPIIDFDGENLGVLEALNKTEGAKFTHRDQLMLDNIAQHAAIALRNSEVYREVIASTERAAALLRVIKSIGENLGSQSLLLAIMSYAYELVQADRCTVFTVDDARGIIFSISSDSGQEVKLRKGQGIVGKCAETCATINIRNAYEDRRFNQEIDKLTGYKTKSIMAVPVTHQSRAIGVIQMINKKELDGTVGQFTDDDVKVIEMFATLVASRLARSRLTCSPTESTYSTETGLPSPHNFGAGLKADPLSYMLLRCLVLGYITALNIAIQGPGGGLSGTARGSPANDPLYPRQASYLEAINVPGAWKRLASTRVARKRVTVALIDSGVKPDHPDLVANLVEGYNVRSGDHDTHEGGMGIAGVMDLVNIMPIFDGNLGHQVLMEAAIDYVITNREARDIKFILMPSSDDKIYTYLTDRIKQADQAGILIILTAGNMGKNITTEKT